MTATKVTSLPDPGVILDLDAIERDPADVKPPFKFRLGGRVLVFLDPDDIDWQDLAAIEVPQDMIRAAMSTSDRSYFLAQPLSSDKFGDLMEAYYDYYEIAEKLKAARRRSQAGE